MVSPHLVHCHPGLHTLEESGPNIWPKLLAARSKPRGWDSGSHPCVPSRQGGQAVLLPSRLQVTTAASVLALDCLSGCSTDSIFPTEGEGPEPTAQLQAQRREAQTQGSALLRSSRRPRLSSRPRGAEHSGKVGLPLNRGTDSRPGRTHWALEQADCGLQIHGTASPHFVP